MCRMNWLWKLPFVMAEWDCGWLENTSGNRPTSGTPPTCAPGWRHWLTNSKPTRARGENLRYRTVRETEMPKGKDREKATLPTHGASVLPSVQVDSYNLEVEDEDGFIGDKASRGAFWDLLEKWRSAVTRPGRRPARRQADRRNQQEEARCAACEGVSGSGRGGAERGRGVRAAAGQGHSPVSQGEGVAGDVVHRGGRRLPGKPSRGARHGPERESFSKPKASPIDIELIRHDPDEAGFIGAAHLLPAWMLAVTKGFWPLMWAAPTSAPGVVQAQSEQSEGPVRSRSRAFGAVAAWR